MKKPNIAEGEWYLRELSSNDFNLETREFIIARHIEKRHAKALKAVPDMIEALMEAYSWINGDTIIPAELGAGRKAEEAILNMIQEALKKAGVNLNEKAE